MKKSILWGILGLVAISGNATAIVIDTTADSELLTNTIVGSNVTVDFSSINYVGSKNQAAIFSDGFSSGLAIDSGIMLTTGNASLAVGPNSLNDSGAWLGTDGDSTMSALLGDLKTYDANILEFDFTTETGDLFFDFVFASEEYNEYLEYNDPFALFIDDINYALAPDGQIVSVGSVNCGATGQDVTQTNCSSFNSNLNPDGTIANNYDIEYDGFTDKFTASILGLSAGVHHMRFIIADANDHEFDSAVFIAANSFSGVQTTEVPAPATLALFALGLCGLRFSRRKNS